MSNGNTRALSQGRYDYSVSGGLDKQEDGMNFAEAYLSGWFSDYRCPCGERYGPDDLVKAAEHFNAGHYSVSGGSDRGI